MANSILHAALPFPIRQARFSVLLPYLDADGDPLDPTTPDTEFSIDAAAFTDTAEEVTTLTGSRGMGYLTLTGAETNGAAIALWAGVASGPKATLMTLYPRVLPILETGTAQAGAAGSITLAAGAAAYSLIGCIVQTTGGTGGGGTGGADNQARVITAYNTSTKVATVVPNWETTPSGTTTYNILMTDMAGNALLGRMLRPTVDGVTLDVTATGAAGIDWGNIENPTTTVGLTGTTVDLVANAVDATAVANGAIDSTAFATGAITSATFAAGAIAAGVIANDAITAAILAPGSIDAATFAPGAIDAAAIANGAIDAATFAAGAINAAAIADGAIDALTFAAGAINAAAIASDAITAAKVADGTIDAATFAASAITATAIATGAITNAKFAAGAIDAAAIATNAIDADALAADALAEINAQVVDALAVDTYAEPGQETPGATITLAAKIGYLYKFLRNRVTSTATTISVYNDDATTVAHKSTHSDDATTYDRGEFTTGP